MKWTVITSPVSSLDYPSFLRRWTDDEMFDKQFSMWAFLHHHAAGWGIVMVGCHHHRLSGTRLSSSSLHFDRCAHGQIVTNVIDLDLYIQSDWLYECLSIDILYLIVVLDGVTSMTSSIDSGNLLFSILNKRWNCHFLYSRESLLKCRMMQFVLTMELKVQYLRLSFVLLRDVGGTTGRSKVLEFWTLSL